MLGRCDGFFRLPEEKIIRHLDQWEPSRGLAGRWLWTRSRSKLQPIGLTALNRSKQVRSPGPYSDLVRIQPSNDGSASCKYDGSPRHQNYDNINIIIIYYASILHQVVVPVNHHHNRTGLSHRGTEIPEFQ